MTTVLGAGDVGDRPRFAGSYVHTKYQEQARADITPQAPAVLAKMVFRAVPKGLRPPTLSSSILLSGRITTATLHFTLLS